MTTITAASRQWASRPDEQRFLSLTDLHAHMLAARATSKQTVVSNRRLQVAPDGADGIHLLGPNGHPTAPTHWAFGQLCARAVAPAGFLRTLPAPIAADVLNYQLRFRGEPEDVGVLLRRGEGLSNVETHAVTGPKYGRIWNAEITDVLTRQFGDGITGDWRVPGEFGKAVEVTKQNTTIYGSDRDMFVFLADEQHRIEVPNRRNGEAGSLARGFFVWNSEVGAQTLGIAFFLFDYVCCNRIVWGAEQYQERRIRHTAAAPDKWLEQVLPVIESVADQSERPVVAAIEAARGARLDDVDAFLAKRFAPSMVPGIKLAHTADEGRPIETAWDAVVGATAYARSIPWQADRVGVERQAGALLDF